MSDSMMPREQAEFIHELERWFHQSTNMCDEDCYRFAFVIWQHSDKLSQMLGCQQGKEERAKVIDQALSYCNLNNDDREECWNCCLSTWKDGMFEGCYLEQLKDKE